MVWLSILLACADVSSEPGGRPGGRPDGGPSEDAGSPSAGNSAPVMREVSVSPSRPRLDETVTCDAVATDPDGDEVELTYTWKRKGRNEALGRGRTYTLDPDNLSTDDTLVCTATATDPHGKTDSANGTAEPRCGFSDPSALRAVDIDIEIVFQPYITEDVEPGWGSEPWDWDGSIPDWIFEVADILESLLETVTAVYPDPDLMTALEAVEAAEMLLEVFDEVAPGLFAATVPPDPDLFPYLVDAEGGISVFWGGVEGVRWDDTYVVAIHLDDVPLSGGNWFVLDMEDVDVSFDDNMGDYLDQGAAPLILTDTVFEEAGYCTAVTYNRRAVPLESEAASIPGSVLWLAVHAE